MLRLRFGLALFFAVAAVARAANLSPLATKPDWQTLEQYQGTITREDFVRLLQNVYATRGCDDLIKVGNENAKIVTDREKNATFTLRFAKENPRTPPRYWRVIDKLAPAPADKPL